MFLSLPAWIGAAVEVLREQRLALGVFEEVGEQDVRVQQQIEHVRRSYSGYNAGS